MPGFLRGNVWHVKCYFGVNEAAMRRHLMILAGLALAAMTVKPSVAVAEQAQQPARQKKQPDGKTQASLTGCVDEQDGQYVLIQEQSRSLIAQLEADGFPTEGFAKHLGHKVTVRGTSHSSGGDRPVFRVRSVEALTDACGPEHQRE